MLLRLYNTFLVQLHFIERVVCLRPIQPSSQVLFVQFVKNEIAINYS